MFSYTPAMFTYWMKDVVTGYHEGTPIAPCSAGIRFLEATDQNLSSDYLYIGEASVMLTVLEHASLQETGVFIIISGHLHPQTMDALPLVISLIEVRLPLLSLYNRIHQYTHAFHAWDMSLQEVIYTNSGLQELLVRASSLIDTTLILVNAGYKHMAAVFHPDIWDPTADELKNNGYQSFDTIQKILHETPVRGGGNSEVTDYISAEGNNYTNVHLIRFRNDLVARLCIIFNGPEPNACYLDLSDILASYVAEYLFSHQGVDYSQNAAFGSLAADLIEHRLTDPGELEERLKQLQLSVRKYYFTMIVSFNHTGDRNMIPWNYVISQLEFIFPFSNITTYDGDILLIIRKTSRSNKPVFDQKKLLHILNHYAGYACISNSSEFLTSLPTVYIQAKEALRLGCIMHPDRRLFYYEDYSMYEMIELASETAHQKLGFRNMVHLCNNEITSLLLYDKKYNTDLVHILHVYLQHERNTTETAKALYMHRNTVLNKIHKIEEIIGDTLDNPNLRDRLIFSHYVLEYMTLYQKEDILELKKTSASQKMN